MYFPHNTVLINFSIIGEMPLLKQLLNGRGEWVESVHAECDNSDQTAKYPDLNQAFDFMRDPTILDRRERLDARMIRAQIEGPAAPENKSLGEAQTIAVITNRGLVSALFITDDAKARSYVRRNKLPIKVLTTAELFALAVNTGRMTIADAERHMEVLQKCKRGVSRKRFDAALRPDLT